MNQIQRAAILKAIKDPDGAIEMGKELLKNASLAECSMAAGKHHAADEKITAFVQQAMLDHGVPREDMGKLLINMGIACWGSGVMLNRESASN